MNISFKLLDADAKMPTRAHDEDAGMDVYCLEACTLKPFTPTQVRTGIASSFETGYVALVWDKSGIAMNRGLKVLGGVIDAGYRGEWVIGLINLTNTPQTFEAGDKIAQVLIQKVEYPEIKEVTELDSTLRGKKGFGSTGK